MSKELRIIPITGIEETPPGCDLGLIIYEALHTQHLTLEPGDILVVTQKIVSKAEGRIVDLNDIKPSAFARQYAKQYNKDARHVEVVLRESRRIVRMDHGVLISETHHGFICANAGVDESNVNGAEQLTLLPLDSDRSAQMLRLRLLRIVRDKQEKADIDIAIIISDTWGRPWRQAQVNMAIGVAGMEAINDYRGQYDPYGYELRVSSIAVADELAATAELVMGKIDRVPVALIRGYNYIPAEGTAQALIRNSATDMFR
ncbi:coenzyme F420-0:L-glutamate ligase [Ktedonosporobacter rubrisoli]|uniref:Coenzyme F420-0:L-glutamate ligase n=1 Tax=Ktedonosporobacter rubrisoli TaxID=2509675 RepID=A0A4P6JRX6_KTERU|nr:coenzyme F420-0:L-glutamate ligase [Ktedonosporobacter rubrisoli]QBD77952.1 coenzyme F420-0:L-glutamate ligase [Ktedonosporobacter rubrisoli]